MFNTLQEVYTTLNHMLQHKYMSVQPAYLGTGGAEEGSRAREVPRCEMLLRQPRRVVSQHLYCTVLELYSQLYSCIATYTVVEVGVQLYTWFLELYSQFYINLYSH